LHIKKNTKTSAKAFIKIFATAIAGPPSAQKSGLSVSVAGFLVLSQDPLHDAFESPNQIIVANK